MLRFLFFCSIYILISCKVAVVEPVPAVVVEPKQVPLTNKLKGISFNPKGKDPISYAFKYTLKGTLASMTRVEGTKTTAYTIKTDTLNKVLYILETSTKDTLRHTYDAAGKLLKIAGLKTRSFEYNETGSLAYSARSSKVAGKEVFEATFSNVWSKGNIATQRSSLTGISQEQEEFTYTAAPNGLAKALGTLASSIFNLEPYYYSANLPKISTKLFEGGVYHYSQVLNEAGLISSFKIEKQAASGLELFSTININYYH